LSQLAGYLQQAGRHGDSTFLPAVEISIQQTEMSVTLATVQYLTLYLKSALTFDTMDHFLAWRETGRQAVACIFSPM
jgi:hypothetical protein